jgi:hypothetical protein
MATILAIILLEEKRNSAFLEWQENLEKYPSDYQHLKNINKSILNLKFNVQRKKKWYNCIQKSDLFLPQEWDLEKLVSKIREYQEQISGGLFNDYIHKYMDARKVDDALNDMFLYLQGSNWRMKYYISEMENSTRSSYRKGKMQNLLNITKQFIDLIESSKIKRTSPKKPQSICPLELSYL